MVSLEPKTKFYDSAWLLYYISFLVIHFSVLQYKTVQFYTFILVFKIGSCGALDKKSQKVVFRVSESARKDFSFTIKELR